MKARILKRSEKILSPWVRLIEKEVDFSRGGSPEIYYSLAPPDYITIFAETPGNLIPVVQQYRPAVEAYTWEFPAGLLEEGEDPVQGSIRELREETGLEAVSSKYIGSYYPDTGRLDNTLHICHIKTTEPDPDFTPEPGMDVTFVNRDELHHLIVTGEFRHLLHIAVISLIEMHIND
ncbi:NUDIX hydrolase [Candidatus Latescibacterota bacterium]